MGARTRLGAHIDMSKRVEEPERHKWAVILPVSVSGKTMADNLVRNLVSNTHGIHQLKLTIGETCSAKWNGVQVYFICIHDDTEAQNEVRQLDGDAKGRNGKAKQPDGVPTCFGQSKGM